MNNDEANAGEKTQFEDSYIKPELLEEPQTSERDQTFSPPSNSTQLFPTGIPTNEAVLREEDSEIREALIRQAEQSRKKMYFVQEI